MMDENTHVGVAIEVEGKIVDVNVVDEVYLIKAANFMQSRWYGAKELKIYKCLITILEEA